MVSGLQDVYTHTAALGPGSAAGLCPLQSNFYAHQWQSPNVSILAQGGDILVITADLRDDLSGFFTLSFLQTTSGGGIQNAFLNIEAAPPTPDILVTPLSIDFGNRPVGSTSSPEVLSLENSGSAELEIFGISDVGPEFVLFGEDCGPLPIRLAPGAACTLSYAFAPTNTGPASATIVIDSNAPGSPHSSEMQGNGIPDPFFSDRFEAADSPDTGNSINQSP